jgi:hypothetical protein
VVADVLVIPGTVAVVPPWTVGLVETTATDGALLVSVAVTALGGAVAK